MPPLRAEAAEMVDPAKNPFFQHADVQLFLARRDGRIVGRISAHIDRLALSMPVEQGFGPGCGQWGLMEAEDEAAFGSGGGGWCSPRSPCRRRPLAPGRRHAVRRMF